MSNFDDAWCDWCGKEIVVRYDKGLVVEHGHRWNGRIFCCRHCMNNSQRRATTP